MSVSFSSLYCKVYFSSFSIFGSQASMLRKLKRKRKESIRIGETKGALKVMVEDLGGTLLSISASLFLCLSFLLISLSPFSVKQSFNRLLFFLFHQQGKSFLLAVCVNKWKEWMIVHFGFQFLERAVFDLLISLSSVLCLSISLSLFSLGLSFSFFYPCSNLSFFCLQQLVSFYTKRALMSGLVSKSESFKRIVRFFLKN